MRKLIVAATVAGALVLITGRGYPTSTHSATRARSTTSTLVTTTTAAPTTIVPAPSTSAHTTTTTARARTPHKTSGSTNAKPRARRPKATVRKAPSPVPLTPTQVAALRALALKTCLVSAATNNLRVVAANNAWYQTQLRVLAAHKKLSGPRYDALVIEESSTKDLIDAQYTIDESNCYIKYA